MSGIRNFNVNHIYCFPLNCRRTFMSLFAYGKGQKCRGKNAVFPWSFETLSCSWWKVSLFLHFPTLLSFLTFSLLFFLRKSTRRGTEAGGKAQFYGLRPLLVFFFFFYSWCSDPAFSSLPSPSNLLNEVHPGILLNFTYFSYFFLILFAFLVLFSNFL